MCNYHFGGHNTLPSAPTSQHTHTFNTDITRIPVSGREGWDSPVRRRREGDRERWGKEGRREGGKEGRREKDGIK